MNVRPRRFNVAAPCMLELHYMAPAAAARVPVARRLMANYTDFVIHARRQTGQTGKTT